MGSSQFLWKSCFVFDFIFFQPCSASCIRFTPLSLPPLCFFPSFFYALSPGYLIYCPLTSGLMVSFCANPTCSVFSSSLVLAACRTSPHIISLHKYLLKLLKILVLLKFSEWVPSPVTLGRLRTNLFSKLCVKSKALWCFWKKNWEKKTYFPHLSLHMTWNSSSAHKLPDSVLFHPNLCG